MEMQWEPDEYRYLCRIADYYHTKPAMLVKQQMRLWIVAEYQRLFMDGGGVGGQQGVGGPGQALHTCERRTPR